MSSAQNVSSNSRINRSYPGPIVPLDFDTYINPLFVGHKWENVTNDMAAFCNNFFISQEINPKRLHVLTAHQGYHFSRKTLAQCLQMHLSKKMQMFDYGPQKNHELYKSAVAPDYQLENITNRYISFIYCKNDFFVREPDLWLLRSRLKVPLYYDHKVQNRRWNHLDFQLGKRSGYFVNYRILEVLKKVEAEDAPKK